MAFAAGDNLDHRVIIAYLWTEGVRYDIMRGEGWLQLKKEVFKC